MTTLPTGKQFPISSGQYGAVVTEVGSFLRSLTLEGTEILWNFAETEAPASKGRQLVPWPNRIRDGRYTFNGVEHQLAISEVRRNTALHGLGSAMAWRLVAHSDSEVTLATTIYPQQGWNGVLDVEVTHSLDESGLTVAVEAHNVGAVPVPYGYGAHPYVAADLTNSRLTLPFRSELVVDPERLLPISIEPVSSEHDFVEPRPVGATVFDTAFVDPIGDWEITLETPVHKVVFWADETLPWAQVFTTPTRDAMAIEPMTCGPDAFNEGPTHDSVIVLEPGERSRSVWGIRVS